MRILYVSHCTEKNGATIALVNIIQGMLSLKNEIGIVMPFKHGFLYNKMMEIGVEIYAERSYPIIMEKPNWQKGIRYYKEYVKYGIDIWHVHLYLLGIIKQFHPDIVHTNTSAIDYALTGCFLTRTPHVWHIREILDKGCGISVYPNMHFLRMKMGLRKNYNIAITQAVFHYYHLKRKDRVIYDGVFDENVKFIKTPLFDFPYFISVGYVNHVKGFLSLIQQFVKFAHSDEKNMHLVIVGNYDDSDPYYQQCIHCAMQNKVIDRVHFLGEREDVYRLISNSTALIVNSPCEGFGFTCVEAMFCNTLVIGRNTAGIKEQFDNGLKQIGAEIGLRYETEEELQEMLHRSITYDFKDMKENARQVVLANYTMRINAQNIYNLYQDILCKKQ